MGYLTDKRIYKYPMAKYNMFVITKLYAMSKQKPHPFFTPIARQLPKAYYLYITDTGIQFLCTEFEKYSRPYLQSIFAPLLIHLDDDIPLKDHENIMRGFTGQKYVPYARDPNAYAQLNIKRNGRVIKKEIFETIDYARARVLELVGYGYSIEDFTIYSRVKDNPARMRVVSTLKPNRVQYSHDIALNKMKEKCKLINQNIKEKTKRQGGQL